MKPNKPLVLGCLALLLPLGFFIYTTLNDTALSASNGAAEPGVEDTSATSPMRTLGAEWDADFAEMTSSPTSQDKKNQESEQDFAPETVSVDVNFVYAKLQEIALDEHGHIQLDDITRRALEEALEATELVLTDYDLEVLSETIHKALPGEVGVEVADLVVTYYNYLRAKEQVLNSEKMPATIDGLRQYQEVLSDLRVATLGADMAERLFKKSENDMKFMLESMALGQNTTLTAEERNARIKILGEKYHQHMPPIEALEEQ